MARGACCHLAADVGAATTGVAGPDPADGQPVGTVHIAVSADGQVAARALSLSGDRAQIRASTVRHVLALLAGVLHGTEKYDYSVTQ
jgi:nicotinamide-nucleotide amidase